MPDPITLSGDRIMLRELNDDDFEAAHSYGSDLEVVRFLPWGPSSEQDTRDFLTTAQEQRETLPRVDFTLAIVRRDTRQLIGTIGLHRKGSNAMLGYALSRDAWGQGFATDAARLILDFGFRTLGVHRIWAGCDPENPGSARVLEKLGMRREGHLREELQVRGEYRDTLLFAVLEHEWRSSPGPPVPKHEVITMRDMDSAYLEPTQEAGRAFLIRGVEGEIVMLNLLRFREVADYSATPDLAPDAPIPGAEAYRLYIDHTLPLLRESGGDVEFMGEGGPFLIGPPDERWDMALLVRHRSVESFMSFASNEAYLGGMGHRLAAITDSRLLPIVARR